MAGRPNARGLGFAFGTGVVNPRFGVPFPFHHHHFFCGSFRCGAFAYPWYWSYYPLDWGSPNYDENYSQGQQQQAYELEMMNNQQQIEQRIGALEDRLERLLTQPSAPVPGARPPEQSKREAVHPAVLVYRDGHTQEVENYAIVGQTLWVLNEQQAIKVPLSRLDLNATRRANEARDVDFALPGSSS
jgi:hypothetical protein